MLAACVLDTLPYCVLDDKGVWQKRLLLVRVRYPRPLALKLILKETILVKSVINALDVVFD